MFRSVMLITAACLPFFSCMPISWTQVNMTVKEREIVPGIKTSRTVQGEPYEIMGKRIVFLNWYYIHPGNDADWVKPDGSSARVKGAVPPFEARFSGYYHAVGIRLKVQPAQRSGPLMHLEEPWEGKGISFTTVIQENHGYRCWGCVDRSKPGEKPVLQACYFESADGMQWERPELGLVEFNGDKRNNLLENNVGSVFIDLFAPEAERYKSVYSSHDLTSAEFQAFHQRRPDGWEPRALLGFKNSNKATGIFGSVSKDGIHWVKLPEPLAVEYSDTQITAYFDAILRKYVMYTRWWSVGPLTDRLTMDIDHRWSGIGRRCIGRSESSDFRNFPVSQMILEPGPEMGPSDVLYTNCKTTIPGAPDQHLLFPAIWHMNNDSTTITVLSSHDGVVWHYLPGAPVFETAPFGQWDGGCVFAVPNLIELPNGDFALPYNGYNVPHKYSRGTWCFLPGYMIWPKGRIAAIEAQEKGEFTMVSIMPPGRKLFVNALTKRAGEIRVLVDGVAGRGFTSCDPIVGDHQRKLVTWKGLSDLGYKDGQPVRLGFQLDQAQLFGLEFE